MRIGINIDQLYYRIAGGTGRYTYHLVKSLLEVDKDNEYVLFHSRVKDRASDPTAGLELGANFSIKTLPVTRSVLYAFWNRSRGFSVGSLVGELDVIHAPTFAIPAKGSSKLVVTIHDLAFLKFPEFFTPRSLKFHQRAAKIAADEADLLLAVSESTRNDIISLLSVGEERVRVVYEGVEIDRSLFDKKQEVLLNYGINRKYILFVGTLEPRKNVVRLLKAFAQAKKETAFEHALVIVGPKGWLYEEILQVARSKDVADNLILTDPVSDAELSVLMNQADAFVYPSLYEGFGLPPLEAMACGAPVIASNVSSLPEVVGDAGILVDPYSIDDISAAMIRVLEDQEFSANLVRKGKERIKNFSWRKAAQESLDAYLSV